MKKLVLLALAIAAAAFGYSRYAGHATAPIAVTGPVAPAATRPASGAQFGKDASNTQVRGSGIVTRVLSDDNRGSRHQRFIIRVPSGRTLLVAHNIDLAPRVAGLEEGDEVAFNGEYEWNPKGGVVHWTHHDPDGQHVAGWLKHDGHVYQ